MLQGRCLRKFVVLFAVLVLLVGSLQLNAAEFLRGDANCDGEVDISDAVFMLMFQFVSPQVETTCQKTLDANDDGGIDIADPVTALSYLFAGGTIPEPFPLCGTDPTDDALTCQSFAPCPPYTQWGEVAASDKPREKSPDVSGEELAELVAGNTAFAFDFYQAVRGEEGNLFYSPYSISAALAMLYAGSAGTTEQQIGDTFHFTLDQDTLHPAFNALDLALESRGEGAEGQDGEGFRLNIANALWGEQEYTFLDTFLDVLAENYGAGMRLLDFKNKPEASRLTINDWVSHMTEGRIQDLIPQGLITTLTRLVLTNAIYFNAAWKAPFPEETTRDAPFYLLDGSEIQVETMSQQASFPVAERPDCLAVELPYDGGELSMVIMVPPEGTFEKFEASLDSGKVQEIVDSLSLEHVQLQMPKFTFRSDFKIAQTLADMGMPIAFDPPPVPCADLSGIDGTRELYVTDVLHKAYVSVNEAGTEAAAATAVVVGVTSIPPLCAVNRPFIFFIRDIETGAVLFVGRVVQPV